MKLKLGLSIRYILKYIQYILMVNIFKFQLKENTTSNKTKALTKRINKHIWEIGTLNQIFIRGSYTDIKFTKTENS